MGLFIPFYKLKHMKHYFLGFAILVFGFGIGYGISVSLLHVDKQKRSMASVQSQYDLTCVPRGEFQDAVKRRIVGGLKSMRKDGMLGLHLGHFTFVDSAVSKEEICHNRRERAISSTDPNHLKKLACKEYPNLSLQFSGDAEATSGAKRQLHVEALCEVASDLAHTEVIWIPWDQLAQETPFEGDIQYTTPTKISIKTMHILDKWPAKWNLEKIELKGASGSISINVDEIRTIAGRPLVFEFKSF